ncbi:MAG: hypothetical protein AB7Y46_16725 [Armatimonadota bacterium]
MAQSPEDHLKEGEMILNDMQRPIEMRYAGAQAHALMAIAKMMLAQHRAKTE